MDKDYISTDIVILILLKINQGNRSLYFEIIFVDVLLDYDAHDHDQIL